MNGKKSFQLKNSNPKHTGDTTSGNESTKPWVNTHLPEKRFAGSSRRAGAQNDSWGALQQRRQPKQKSKRNSTIKKELLWGTGTGDHQLKTRTTVYKRSHRDLNWWYQVTRIRRASSCWCGTSTCHPFSWENPVVELMETFDRWTIQRTRIVFVHARLTALVSDGLGKVRIRICMHLAIDPIQLLPFNCHASWGDFLRAIWSSFALVHSIVALRLEFWSFLSCFIESFGCEMVVMFLFC